ncbi:MAG: hypothetical protein D6824_03655 [Planctomycetota bacterium]|nr:MAG: hypothetical protein D6824_03655 [Planctomycetota bacterium]
MMVAGAAYAGSQIDLNLNSVVAKTFDSSGAPGFSTSGFTGTIVLSNDADSQLADVILNGSPQTLTEQNLDLLSGEITVSNGQVTGGFFDVVLANGAGGYSTTVIPGTGNVNVINNSIVLVDGLTLSGIFTSAGGTFAGVPLGAFDTSGLFGSFLTFSFQLPTAANGYTDNQSNLNLSAVIPLPSAAGLGGFGLLALLGVRRRRC